MKTILGISLLLFAACAHAPQSAAVVVIINASDGAAGRVDTAALQRITEQEIQRSGGARQPLTLTAFFNASGFVERPNGPLNPTLHNTTVVSPQSVSDLSATPWEDGLIVQHGERIDVGARSNRNYRREVVVGTYTISDGAGNVIEQRPVVVGALDPEIAMISLQVKSMRTTGHYLASRVAERSK